MYPNVPITAAQYKTGTRGIVTHRSARLSHYRLKGKGSLGKMDKNRNGCPVFPSISSITVALLPGLIGRSGSKWTINTKRV